MKALGKMGATNDNDKENKENATPNKRPRKERPPRDTKKGVAKEQR